MLFEVLCPEDKAYLITRVDKSQHLFVEIFPIVLTAYTILKNLPFHGQSAQKIRHPPKRKPAPFYYGTGFLYLNVSNQITIIFYTVPQNI